LPPKIFLISLGCPRNLVDSEVLIGILKKHGYILTEDAKEADIYIVNTCAFIEDAKRESLDTILELASYKNKGTAAGGGPKTLIVTGCLSQRYPGDLKADLPEVDAFFGTSDFIKIPDFLKKRVPRPGTFITKRPDFLYDHTLERSFITPAHYAYVKIQEGCVNCCSYCVIPAIRGAYRSRSFSSVLSEVRKLRMEQRCSEIDLIGQDTTLYGIDRYKKPRTAELVRKVSKIMAGGWVRLLYAHPAHLSDDLIDAIAEEGPVCKYIDLPIQHCSDKILKSMNRGVTKDDIIKLVEKIRGKIPGSAIRTSVMVGFPGETEHEFQELISFIKGMKFERLGAFTFSREEGTAAYNMPGQVPEREKNKRYDILLSAQKEIAASINSGYLGRICGVLIEEAENEKGLYYGRTEHDAPEVDGGCFVRSAKKLKPGDFVKVRVTDTFEYDLVGESV